MQRGGMIALLFNIFRSRYLGQVAAFAICIPGNGDVTTFGTRPPHCFCIALVDCDDLCLALSLTSLSTTFRDKREWSVNARNDFRRIPIRITAVNALNVKYERVKVYYNCQLTERIARAYCRAANG